jgi:hypothetical protein
MRYLLLLLLFGCRATPSIELADDPRETAIYGGVADHDAHSAVVMLAHESDDGWSLCTATLVAPRVLLTAAHCVLRNSPAYISCGGSVAERTFTSVLAKEIEVHVGLKPKLEAPPAARGRRIFLPKLGTLCDRDVAAIVLDDDLELTPMTIADELPGDKEAVTAVGYGRTERGTYGERRRREGMRVVNVGPHWDDRVWLGARELETTAGPCSGDSGGPLLSAEERVLGVVSRGGSCRSSRGNVYTSAIAYAWLVEDAIAWSNAHP